MTLPSQPSTAPAAPPPPRGGGPAATAPAGGHANSPRPARPSRLAGVVRSLLAFWTLLAALVMGALAIWAFGLLCAVIRRLFLAGYQLL